MTATANPSTAPKTETPNVAAPATPNDAAPAEQAAPADGKKKRRTPRRFRLFDDGKGDYRVCEIIPQGHKTLPAGALIPVSELGGFETAVDAKKAIRASGNLLTGKQCILMKGVEIVKIEIDTKPRVVIDSKPRVQVGGPPTPTSEPVNA